MISLVIKGRLEWEGKDPTDEMRDMIILPTFLVSGVHGNEVPNASYTPVFLDPSCLPASICDGPSCPNLS